MLACSWRVLGSSYKTVNQKSFYQTLAEVCVCNMWSTLVRHCACVYSYFSRAHMMFVYPVRLQNHPEAGVNAHLCGPGGNPRILDVQIYASYSHTVSCADTHFSIATSAQTFASPSANNAGLYVNRTPISGIKADSLINKPWPWQLSSPGKCTRVLRTVNVYEHHAD